MELVTELSDREAGVGIEALESEMADGDGAVIALDHERTERGFGSVFKQGATGGAGDLDILVDEKTVEKDFGEAGVFGFLAGGVEARGLELDVERLPEAGSAAGVGAGGGAFVTLFAGAAGGVPALVNAPAVGGGGIFFAPAVEELHFVAALEVDAGVGAGGQEEFEVEFDVAMVPGGEEVTAGVGRFAGVADEHAGAGQGGERFLAPRVAAKAGGELPVGRDRLESGERIEGDARGREERLGADGEREDGESGEGAGKPA